eukprot:1941955-Alexandrium_andersonii.AAC.1
MNGPAVQSLLLFRVSLSGPGSDLRLRAVATALRRHERIIPGEGLVSVTTSRDHENGLAYSLPLPAVPAVAAALVSSGEGLAPRLAVVGGAVLLCGVPPSLTRVAEEQLGLERWTRRSSPAVQLWRGARAPSGSTVRFLHAGLGHDL